MEKEKKLLNTETWSTKNYLLTITCCESEKSTNCVEINIYKKYFIDEHYRSDKLIKKIKIIGDIDGINLLLMSYEDKEVEKLLKNIKLR